MNSTTKTIRIACFVVVFVLLALVTRISAAAQQQSQILVAKAPAEIILEEKIMEPAEIKREKEAAERAQQAADEKAKLKYEKKKAKVEQLELPEDTSPQLTVRQLQFSGNLLISTEELLENMPVVYNASDMPLREAESIFLYDFRPLHELIIQPGQPQQVSTRTIQGLTQYVLSMYQKQNYAGIYVYVPAEALKGQELEGGILPVQVLEATVAGVTVRSFDPNHQQKEKGYLRHSAIEEWSPVQPGRVASQKELDDFVNLLNLNPDRYVSAVVTKGPTPQTLAVGYDIYEANPWHFFAQLDNAGTKDRKWTPRVGLINTNLLGIDDTFTAVYQAPPDSGWDENYSIYGSYDFPLLGPRLRLRLYGGYSEFDVTPASGGINFIGNGSFYGGVLRYNVLQFDRWFFDVTGSMEHVRSKVTPSLFPSELGTDVKMNLWGMGLNLHRRDDMSSTSIEWNRVETWWGSSESEFALARPDAHSDFTIHYLSGTQTQYLDPNKVQRLSASLRWIHSDRRLVPAKMTTFGGMYSVRGYDEYEVVADGGLLASAQYEFDLVKYDQTKAAGQPELAEPKDKKPFIRKLAPLAFIDFGRAEINFPTATEKGHYTLLSVGLGALLELGDNFSGGVYYGYPLRATDDTRRGKGRVNVGFMMRW